MVKFESALNRILDDFREEFSLPGYDCAVWQHSREIYRRISGLADLETGTPVTRSTLYNLYSNTKVIACVAAFSSSNRDCSFSKMSFPAIFRNSPA